MVENATSGLKNGDNILAYVYKQSQTGALMD